MKKPYNELTDSGRYKRDRAKNKLCRQCGKSVDKTSLCDACRETERGYREKNPDSAEYRIERAKKRVVEYKRRKSRRLCIRCPDKNIRKASPTSVMCEKHRKYINHWQNVNPRKKPEKQNVDKTEVRSFGERKKYGLIYTCTRCKLPSYTEGVCVECDKQEKFRDGK